MRLRRPIGQPSTGPLPRRGITAQEVHEETGNHTRGVPVDQPVPPDMPLALAVLDSLADDCESIYTMRVHSKGWEPDGLELVGENFLLAAIRALMSEGLIEVESEYVVEGDQLIFREPPGAPGTADDDLKRYWFVMTRAGWAAWEAGAPELDSYLEANPSRRKKQPQ